MTLTVANLKSSPGGHKAVISKSLNLRMNKSLQMMKNKSKNQRMKNKSKNQRMKKKAKMILNKVNVFPRTSVQMENRFWINGMTLATGMAEITQLGADDSILKSSTPTICAANVEVVLVSETAVLQLVTF